jgi:hypothetical protein
LFSTLKRAIGRVKHLSYDSRMRLCRLALLLLLVGACRTPPLEVDGGPPPGSDLASVGDLQAVDLALRDLHGTPTSCCGVVGNPGNELGVGEYCDISPDCAGQPADICATTFSSMLHFCTKSCSRNVPNDCGSGAECRCSASGQCACVPGECITPPPGC